MFASVNQQAVIIAGEKLLEFGESTKYVPLKTGILPSDKPIRNDLCKCQIYDFL
jgi:hypothetical protein